MKGQICLECFQLKKKKVRYVFEYLIGDLYVDRYVFFFCIVGKRLVYFFSFNYNYIINMLKKIL